MDKYENNLKLDQIKSLFADEKYEEAADIADTINWNKLKNPTALLKLGEVYEKVGRYAESKEILLAAYDRSPIGRGIIYRLAEVAIKMGDFSLANTYYDEFVDLAPHDNLKYVLRYNIKKAQGAPISDLISILEDLREQEYTEEWAYELAYLYHKAGLCEKCIEACDELILWFGDGPYVERALELKMLYQPLTKAQKEKYSSFRQAKDGYTHINIETMQKAGEYIHEPVAIPEVTLSPERFNTTNLQEVIASGMQQIQNATETSTITDTMDNIQRMTGEIPFLHDSVAESADEEEHPHIETDEEIDSTINLNFQELLCEESDGQIHMMTDDKSLVERQITGQITIEEILEEWDRTKRAAEAVLRDAEQRKLESAKARALQQAENLMDRLSDVQPKLDAGMTPRDLFEEEYQKQNGTSIDEELPEIDMSLVESGELEKTKEFPRIERLPDTEEPSEETMETEESDVVEETEQSEVMGETEDTEEAELPENEVSSEKEEELPVIEEVTEFEDLEEENEPAKLEQLTEEQKAIFSYFMPVKGMEDQLCQAIHAAKVHFSQDSTATAGNLIIQGDQGCGKTTLATSLIKVLQQETGHPSDKIGKIHASALNKKDVGQLLRKVAGGCLIIEQAGDLERPIAVALALLLEQDKDKTLIILEDTSKGIKKALSLDDRFAKKFTQTITVPIFTNDELVVFARSYSKELGYDIEEMAILALYNRISNIQRLDQATTLTEVKEIVDEAISREARWGLKKYFSILTARRYTDDDRIVLREKDFA